MPVCTSPPVACNNQSLNSATVQRKIWRQFLCLILAELSPGTECTNAALLVAADNWLCQQSTQKLQLLQVQQMCENLDIDCTAKDCLTPLQEEAIISYLVCSIINEID